MFNYIITGIVALAVSIGGFFGISEIKNNLGGFSDPFISIQLASSPSNGYYLTSDGTNNVWSASSGSGATVFGELGDVATSSDAEGDIYYQNSSGQITNLGAGSDGEVLKLASGIPSWGTDNGTFSWDKTTFGSTNANSTSTLLGLTGGFYALASSTVGAGTQSGGLTIWGGATTTGASYLQGTTTIGYGTGAATINGTTYYHALQVSSDDATQNAALLLERNSTSCPFGCGIHGLRSLGDRTSKLVVIDGTDLLNIFASGYDGTDYATAANIKFEVDGTPGSNDMPGRISFYTSPDGSQTLAERMRIDNAGNVGIGTTNPQTKLDVFGTASTTNLFVQGNSTTTNATTTDFYASKLTTLNAFITKLGNLTSNGFITTSGSDGTLSVDTTSYLSGNQTITLSGDVTGSGTTAITTTIDPDFVTWTLASTTLWQPAGLLSTASSTINGNLVVVGNSTTTNATTTTFAVSNILNSILSTNGIGSVVASTSIGVNYLSGILPVANGGTGASTLTGLLKGNGAGAITGSATINNGDWSGTDLAVANGGTGLSTFGGSNTVLYTSAADTLTSSSSFTFDGTVFSTPQFLATASSTLQNFTFKNATGTAATTTNLFATTASTTNFYGAGLPGAGCSGSDFLQWASGLFSCGTPAGGGTFSWDKTTFGSTNANSTSTLIGFTQGLYSLASSTIGDGTQIGGLTIHGGATTTGNQYIGGSLTIGTGGGTSDSYSVYGPDTSNQWILGYDVTDKTFAIASSTALGTTNAFSISKTGLAATLGGALTVTGNLTPASNDGGQLGVSGTAWSDLFLASGSVINWNAGDLTLTHSSNLLTLAGGNLTLGANSLTAGSILANSNDVGALGASGTAWSDLFLASGGVINFNAGNYTMTHSASLLTLSNSLTLSSGIITAPQGSFTNATSTGTFALPVGSAPNVSSDGQCAIDTTSGQFKCDVGTKNTRVIYPGTKAFSFSHASSTQGAATTTHYIGVAPFALTVTQARCDFSNFMGISLFDGTNRADYFVASSTVGTVTYTTNNTFTSGEPMRLDVGTSTNIAATVSGGCTLDYTATAD